MAKILMLKQVTVVRLFEALGFKTSKTWDKERLLKKIKQLPELVDGVKIKNPKVKLILKKILRSKKIGIRMTNTTEPERPSEAAMRKSEGGKKKKVIKKKSTKKKEKAAKPSDDRKTKKKKKKEVDKTKVDSFGLRLGTQGSLICSKLSTKKKSVATIAKETKLPIQRVYNHLRFLLREKMVELVVIKDVKKYFIK